MANQTIHNFLVKETVSICRTNHGIRTKMEYILVTGWPDLDPKLVRLDPNGTNSGLFQIRFQYILAVRQNVLKSDLKKSRICLIWGQSDPFWVQIWWARPHNPWVLLIPVNICHRWVDKPVVYTRQLLI